MPIKTTAFRRTTSYYDRSSLSSLRPEDTLAIFCSDLHLSLTPPALRSVEPNWLEAMKRQLDELKEVQQYLKCPIFCAGDIFDCWYGAYKSSELINFALENLPKMYAIPGQHDLPHHNNSLVQKAAIYTLTHNKTIDLLNYYKYKKGSITIEVTLVPFGMEIPKASSTADVQICIHHRYVCTSTDKYAGASEKCYVSALPKEVLSYDVAVFGDNHKGFTTRLEKTLIWNCGTFFIRKADELKYQPRLGILLDDKSIVPYHLDCSKDLYLQQTKLDNYIEKNIEDFVKSLQQETDSIDFVEAIEQYIQNRDLPKEVTQILIKLKEL